MIATVVTATGVFAACQDITNPRTSELLPPPPRSEVTDATHNGGTPHFYFLSPVVSQPKYSGTFDRSLLPIVEICEVSGSACGSIIASYSTTNGVGGETVRMSVSDESYGVNWNTRSTGASAGNAYRIRVKVLQTELGHADVSVVANMSGGKAPKTGDYASVVVGGTLAIRFRIEKGAVAYIGSAGGIATLNGGAVLLNFPAGATSTAIAVTATPVASGSLGYDGSVIGGTDYEFQPSPTTFTQPVTLSLSYPRVLPRGVKESRLAVCKMIDGACRALRQSVVNSSAHSVTAKIAGFSSYGVTLFPEMLYMEASGAGYWLHTDTAEIPMPSNDGSWAPDGSRFVYQAGDGYSYDLHMVNADGSNDHHLVGDRNNGLADDARCPRWAPDGSRILYHGQGAPATILPDGTGVMNPLTGVDGWDTDWCAERWHPDSRHVAFRAFHQGVSAFWSMNVDGTELRELMPGSHYGDFGWSADGTKFAFYADWAGDLVGSGIYVMNADGSNLHFLDITHASSVLWSPVPGDNRLLFLGGCDDVYGNGCSTPIQLSPGIWIINSDGTGARQILSVPMLSPVASNITSLSWSPEGSRISFTWSYGPLVGCDNNVITTYLLNLDGSGLQTLPTGQCSVQANWRP